LRLDVILQFSGNHDFRDNVRKILSLFIAAKIQRFSINYKIFLKTYRFFACKIARSFEMESLWKNRGNVSFAELGKSPVDWSLPKHDSLF